MKKIILAAALFLANHAAAGGLVSAEASPLTETELLAAIEQAARKIAAIVADSIADG